MAVRGKFVVTGLQQHYGGVRGVILECRYDTSIPEDKRFYDATPSGRIEMTINNRSALDQMILGKAFYVDFTEIPKEEE